eukprot:TRINITY_DN60761_c0_g1_i1.p1 TRINITY_DN60761_c0_g1~~TRINITY_DN60761_c0_g1_i1.p1  ORF type:complete len:331 (+),score=77.21 TRINITY_DN60761_c0_g1_i1:109-1101(+)
MPSHRAARPRGRGRCAAASSLAALLTAAAAVEPPPDAPPDGGSAVGKPVPTPIPTTPSECVLDTADGPIDLTRLETQQYHLTVTPCEAGFKFYFMMSFCQSLVTKGPGGKTCPAQFGGPSFYALQTDEEALGCQFAWNEMHQKPAATKAPWPGLGEEVWQVTFEFKGVQKGSVFPFGAPRYMSTTLVCDLSLYDEQVIATSDALGCTGRGYDYDPWHFSWSFRTRWACPEAPPMPPPPPPPVHGTSLVLVLLGASVVAYLVAGVAINRYRGFHGTDMIPNKAFWADLPLLVRDGAVFAYCSARDAWRGSSVPRVRVSLATGPAPRTYTSI